MNSSATRAIIACGNQFRRAQFANALLQAGWNVHTVSTGSEMLDLLRKQRYALTVLDESLHDLATTEGALYVRDLAPNEPEIIIAGEGTERHQQVWARAGVRLSASADEVLRQLPGHVQGQATVQGTEQAAMHHASHGANG